MLGLGDAGLKVSACGQVLKISWAVWMRLPYLKTRHKKPAAKLGILAVAHWIWISVAEFIGMLRLLPRPTTTKTAAQLQQLLQQQ